jgi:hypothetical protein
MCHCNVSSRPALEIFTQRYPENEIGEREIREELPIGNQLSQAMNLLIAEWAPSAEKLLNCWHR